MKSYGDPSDETKKLIFLFINRMDIIPCIDAEKRAPQHWGVMPILLKTNKIWKCLAMEILKLIKTKSSSN